MIKFRTFFDTQILIDHTEVILRTTYTVVRSRTNARRACEMAFLAALIRVWEISNGGTSVNTRTMKEFNVSHYTHENSTIKLPVEAILRAQYAPFRRSTGSRYCQSGPVRHWITTSSALKIWRIGAEETRTEASRGTREENLAEGYAAAKSSRCARWWLWRSTVNVSSSGCHASESWWFQGCIHKSRCTKSNGICVCSIKHQLPFFQNTWITRKNYIFL